MVNIKVELPEIIDENHYLAPNLLIRDENDIILGRIKSLNIKTLKVQQYKVVEGKVEMKWKNEDNPHLLPRFEGDICGRELVVEEIQLKSITIKFR